MQAKNQKLSSLDISILKLICQEKTNKEIAAELCLTSDTVEYLLKRLREKTGSMNNVGLSHYALKKGYYRIS